MRNMPIRENSHVTRNRVDAFSQLSLFFWTICAKISAPGPQQTVQATQAKSFDRV